MIKAKGFFDRFLKTQLEGLTGNIGVAGYPFAEVEWGAQDYISSRVKEHCTWWPYEQTGYWLDGYLRAGIILNDKSVIDNASRIIYNTILNPDKDGYIGPLFMKNADFNYRWPHVVFFRACIALYDYNKDDRILSALEKHYLGSDFAHDKGRDVINVEIMCLLYERTKNYALIERAERDYISYNKQELHDWRDDFLLSNKKPYVHGVTYNEMVKLPILLYKYTGKKYYQKVALAAIKNIQKYFMLPGGIPNTDEYLESNYYYYCYETCNITDFTWALSYFQKTLNDAKFGDMIETCVFNAGMGSVLEDFKGLQYMSCANQLILDNTSTHCECYRGNQQMTYRPNPFTECCCGNVNRFMPNYILNMWRTEGDSVYCDLFGASEYSTSVFGKDVLITEETNFPFTEDFTFNVKTKTPFTLYIRKPSYIKDYVINANGAKLDDIINGYFVIKIESSVTLHLSFSSEVIAHYIKPIKSKKVKEGVYFSKGVLVYANGQKGDRIIDESEVKQSKDFPAYNILPNKEWGYGVSSDANPIFNGNVNATVFDLDTPLPTITVDGAKIINAGFVRKKTLLRRVEVSPKGRKFSEYVRIKGDFTYTPDLLKTDNIFGNDVKVTLYPYGACKIRQTVFPIKR